MYTLVIFKEKNMEAWYYQDEVKALWAALTAQSLGNLVAVYDPDGNDIWS